MIPTSSSQPRDSLTPAQALTFLNLADRSRTRILKDLAPQERESVLLSVIQAIREIPAEDRRAVLIGSKPLSADQLGEYAEELAA